MTKPLNPQDYSRNDYSAYPDAAGRFGDYGGRYVAETLMPNVLALETAWREAKADPAYQGELKAEQRDYIGRPSPLYFAKRLSEHYPVLYRGKQAGSRTSASSICARSRISESKLKTLPSA